MKACSPTPNLKNNRLKKTRKKPQPDWTKKQRWEISQLDFLRVFCYFEKKTSKKWRNPRIRKKQSLQTVFPRYIPQKKRPPGFCCPEKKHQKKKLGFQETSKDSSLGCHASLALKKVVRKERNNWCFPHSPGCCGPSFWRLSFWKTVWSLSVGVFFSNLLGDDVDSVV